VTVGARQHERVNASVPVHLEDGSGGQTVNLSPTGVFFVTDQPMAEGGSIRFTIEFENEWGSLLLECHGEIVRIEQAAGRIGVAARIRETQMQRRSATTRRQGVRA
jgi:hypothetical protein